MINARPGSWDLESWSWIGVEPTYVVPPLRRADHAPVRAVGATAGVPAPRQDSDPVAVEPPEADRP